MKKFLCLIVASALAMVVSAQEVKENVTVKVKGGYELKGSVEQNGDSVKITTENGDVFVYRSNEIVSIADASGNVQKKGKEKTKSFSDKGYMGYVDLSAGYELYWYGGTLFQVTTTHGYRCTPHVFVGGGTGLSLFKPDNASAQGSSYYRDINARVFIPIYATCRVSLLKNRRVSPFVGINIGYNLDIAAGKSQDWRNYNESYSGVLVDPSVGIEIATNKRLAFFIAANCNTVITGDTGIFISGKIGVAF